MQDYLAETEEVAALQPIILPIFETETTLLHTINIESPWGSDNDNILLNVIWLINEC